MERSIGEAERGLALGREAGAALTAIETSVRQVAREVEGIATAMDEAVAQTESVSRAIMEVADITAGNRQAAEQMLSASAQVAAAMDQIATTGEEHRRALREVSGGTDRLREATERVLQAARELSALGGDLQREMADFRNVPEAPVQTPTVPTPKALPAKRSA